MEKFFLYLTGLSPHLAYFAVFAVLIACGLGFPLPEDVPLIASGYLIWEGTMDWFPALSICLIGVLVGDTALYYLGKRVGLSVLRQKRFQNFFKPEKVRRTRAYFRKYGERLVFFARFVAGFRAIVFFMAGAMKVKYSKFFLLDGLAALVSVPLWILLGYGLGHFFGDEISKVLKSMHDVKNVITIIILVIVCGFAIRVWFNFRAAAAKKRKA
jgi:membrane protein DedA with SNARE-associated domain